MYKWYVIQSKPNQAARAATELERQNFEVFYPTITSEKLHRGKKQLVQTALFPNYLFIHLSLNESNWRPIRSTYGVARMITFGVKPAIVPDQVIETLLSKVEGTTPETLYSTEQSVEIEQGVFAGLEAVFESYDGEARAFLLLKLLGQWQRIALPLKDIKPSSE